MTALPVTGPFSRIRFERSADWMAAALAASLPWSTSATSILAVLWLIALLPTLDVALTRRVARIPAGTLPVLLVALAVCGLAWASGVSWPERFAGLAQFAKLLAIPLLLIQFARSDQGKWPLIAFLASAMVLLAYSWLLLVVPGLPSRGYPLGVPIKDYVIQSEIFAICALVLFDRAVAASKEARWQIAMLLTALGLVFVLNVAFVATARTTLVIMAVLMVLLGIRHFSRVQLVVFLAGIVACAAVAWMSSPYLRERVSKISEDVAIADSAKHTSVGARLYFWQKSIAFIQDAPVFGHGTGSVRDMFRRSASDPSTETASNPHNQIFAVGIQLGFLGIVVLAAMWISHARLFIGAGAVEWIGLVVVVQNVVGSLFNSHLFDFTQGWLYVIGVGVTGGMMLRQKAKAPP
jgi:O-antigen ligase